MKWIITGGAGFIGANIATRLTAAGEDCVLCDNFHSPGAKLNQALLKQACKLPVHYLDVRYSDHVNRFWETNSDAGVILHLAGQVSLLDSIRHPRYDFETNALGTFNVLEATRHYTSNARLIYASTNKVYGNLAGFRYPENETRYAVPQYPSGFDETLPIELHSGYACSKGAADQYVRDYRAVYGLKTISLRQSSIYGGNQHASEDQGWVAYFVQMGVRGKRFEISGNGKQVRDLLHVADLFDCYQNIANLPDDSPAFGQAFNIGGGVDNSLSLLELFLLLREDYGLPMNYTAGPPRPGDQKVFIADTKKAQRLLGWNPRTGTEEGLNELLSWSRAEWPTEQPALQLCHR